MKISDRIKLKPAPGSRLLKFRGDTVTFTLYLADKHEGVACLRTNIGHADITRREVIRNVLYDYPPLGRDWFDIPMVRVDNYHFRATLPLCQEGHFEAKSYFVSKKDGETYWPKGANIVINVEPADTCCANIIYNVFVRQFGPNKSGGFFESAKPEWFDTLDKSGYAVIPPSGTFRDLIAELDFIINELGCRILQLLPIHPTPTTYARMGRFGSPYAALTFTAVDPALAEFDPTATPLEQFVELVDAIHSRNAKLMIDIAINHTGWAAGLHETHPDWLVRDATGKIEVPEAWGVRWEDLTKLDYSRKDLWVYMADVFLTWCRRGVDGFRCDAAYMVPVPAWQYIIASVRDQFPGTIFFLEGLGGKISVTRDLLNRANFNWAYSELFQNYDRSQIEQYLPEAINISNSDGVMLHYAETHDNPRLASRSQAYARIRTTFSALCSQQGAFGFANGVEWYATEKINVHESPSLNWGAATNQVREIRRLTTLLKNHPAFFDQTSLRLVPQEQGNCIVLIRHNRPGNKMLMVVINLDDQKPNTASWNPKKDGFSGSEFLDLLT
ncbi:glycogen debranching protein, partial [Thermodesulfobacteriota bacterium]